MYDILLFEWKRILCSVITAQNSVRTLLIPKLIGKYINICMLISQTFFSIPSC